ncbi:DUF1631 family protein [Tibeticola sp.]|uniref:DUF1631 family protein n=1 Tax=Tibeticola sp. TaxID=2005368 RepID=UPI00258A0E42|nr:DUF1631 family protein [Tibeticola sp.]MCI4441799.1 DUF1631 family protein [Tibeticola sp.]
MNKPAALPRIGLIDPMAARKPTVSACLEMALAQAPGLIDQVLDGLLLALTAGSKGAAPDAPRPALLPAIRQLVERRDSLRKAFTGQLRILSFGGGSSDRVHTTVRFDELQFFDARALDESIELARVQRDVEVAVSDVRPRFDALMSSVMGWISVQPTINPLRPEIWAQAYRDAFAAHLPVPELRSELLAVSSGRFAAGVRQLYRELSEWMAAHQVEPAVTERTALATAAAGAAAATDAPASEAARTVLTLERLRRLFNADVGDLLRGPNLVAPAGDFLHTVPACVVSLQDMKQVEAMIARLEAQRSAKGGARAARQQADALRRRPLEGRALAQQIGEEVGRLMVENLLADERLLPPLRDQLRRLEPMLVSLARSDMRFFSEAHHPARQWLDQVTDRSLAFPTAEDPGFDAFLASVEEGVEALLRNPAGGADAFTRALAILKAHWAEADRQLLQQREEAARALLHIEQRNLLAQRLVEQWSTRLADKPVPALVRGFILGPWAQVVAEAQLRGVADEASVRAYQAVIEPLVWSVQPRLARRNPAHLVKIIPGLLATLRSGLELLGRSPEQIGLFFDALIACHEEVLREARARREAAIAAGLAVGDELEGVSAEEAEASGDAAQAGATLAEAAAVMPADTPWLAENETEHFGYIEADAVLPVDPESPEVPWDARAQAEAASDAIAEGAWVELLLDGQWTRLKLTWSSPHRTLFMFTSSRGRAHSMSRRSMARLLASGMIRIVSAGLMVDGALDAVAQQALRNSLGQR